MAFPYPLFCVLLKIIHSHSEDPLLGNMETSLATGESKPNALALRTALAIAFCFLVFKPVTV